MALKVKTIKGRGYYYLDESQRIGGKVVTKSRYLGAVHPRRKSGLTLGVVLGQLFKGGVVVGAAAVSGKLRDYPQSKARAPDKRSVAAERERWIDLAHRDPKAAVADIQARARVSAMRSAPAPDNPELKAQVQEFTHSLQAHAASPPASASTSETAQPSEQSASDAAETGGEP